MNKIFTVFSLILFSFFVSAQSRKEVRGDLFYSHKQYSEAIVQYERVIAKDSSNLDVKYKLYKSYQFSNNYHSTLYRANDKNSIVSPVTQLFASMTVQRPWQSPLLPPAEAVKTTKSASLLVLVYLTV